MVDLYTKSVLTVIAIALVVLAARSASRTAIADGTPPVQRVVLCDLQTHCAKLAGRVGSNGSDYFVPTISLQPGP